MTGNHYYSTYPTDADNFERELLMSGVTYIRVC